MNGTWKIPRGTSTIPEPGSLSTPSSSVSPPPPPLPLALSLHSSGLLKHFHSLSPHFLLPQRLFTCLVVGGLKARRWMQQLKIGRRRMKIWWDLIFLGKHSQNTGVVGGCQQTLLMKSYNTNRTEFQEKTPHTIHAYFSRPWTRGKGLREDEGLGWACENTRSVRQLREERGGGQEAGDGLGTRLEDGRGQGWFVSGEGEKSQGESLQETTAFWGIFPAPFSLATETLLDQTYHHKVWRGDAQGSVDG